MSYVGYQQNYHMYDGCGREREVYLPFIPFVPSRLLRIADISCCSSSVWYVQSDVGSVRKVRRGVAITPLRNLLTHEPCCPQIRSAFQLRRGRVRVGILANIISFYSKAIGSYRCMNSARTQFCALAPAVMKCTSSYLPERVALAWRGLTSSSHSAAAPSCS